MKEKSQNSLKAAQLLIDTHDTYGYDASIHCSYYALLQYMKYKLATHPESPLEYDKQVSSGSGSHNFILQKVKERMKDSSKEQMFAKKFLKLKKLRILADYEQKSFTEAESLDCRKLVEKAMNMLNQYL